jgi:hypothetical protein
LVALIGQQVATGFAGLREQTIGGWQELQRQLAASSLHLTSTQVGELGNQAAENLRGNSDQLLTGVLRVGSTAADIGTGFFIVLFSALLLLVGTRSGPGSSGCSRGRPAAASTARGRMPGRRSPPMSGRPSL